MWVRRKYTEGRRLTRTPGCDYIMAGRTAPFRARNANLSQTDP